MEDNSNRQIFSQMASGGAPQIPAMTRRTPEMDAIVNNLSEVASNLRILEDKYSNLRKKFQLTDQTLLDLQKSMFKDKKLLTEELTDAKLKLQELTEDLLSMKSELKDTVKQNDIKVLDRYLDFWEPMQYVTRKEVENLIDNINENSINTENEHNADAQKINKA